MYPYASFSFEKSILSTISLKVTIDFFLSAGLFGPVGDPAGVISIFRSSSSIDSNERAYLSLLALTTPMLFADSIIK